MNYPYVTYVTLSKTLAQKSVNIGMTPLITLLRQRNTRNNPLKEVRDPHYRRRFTKHEKMKTEDNVDHW